ncbi:MULTISPECIES: CusA/CzcA family heavy metal efflux RND transporter [Flavobacteriaceae]|uniref:CusA/CzcA family heavy metal efflux RND transporter n=2 Tax=Flavobacteriaceae TaxID=49546 RepID=A0A4Y8AXF2_9FLAO|nr:MULTISPECIES: CusA/CzcA family heavy metal efflux RND transporter [Flavobacteriaceae]TEW76815.1 CusA/CzcA family heavy metal efflux RND transporter [Gramella jeungdoensis]GGK49766.1 acriflavine resistance protein B [Lutibacter litoralis]
MLHKIIKLSIDNKLIILLITAAIAGFGIFSLTQIPIGAVPDITNNQVQVITTSKNLSTQDVEQFITYPVELEMANLPGVTEIRSISKFGLSVVTIVFEDAMGTYLPRQLISEKIKSASEKIPEGFGTPEMGPITTGLGEIYQYTLDTKPEFKDRYSAMELRTLQDWVVKRQLSGIPGVVEVNTWGGFLKQYEVALNPEKLKSMNITHLQVLDALERNNSVAGGGYIEKASESYFVRGEGMIKSLSDIENVVVKNVDGVPILIKNIAEVNFGFANRFGAITGNGEGEKVLGQVMMLKDGDSNLVIEAVKERVAEIQKTLPEGVFINGFLERSELIGKTTFTIAENLIIGIIIVIFVVILLLGSMRSGMVVASVIPLSLLFTLSMMYIFDVDANLMSLGAIDFGIIIDGAVIIVEFIAFKITSSRKELMLLSKSERQENIDEITWSSSSKMMTSAIFGQLIILIVFIPILSLSGVEGKMFKPMAMAFSFALIGAMFLCFTYVPVISSIFLKPEKVTKNNVSKRLMAFFYAMYQPVIKWSLVNKKIVISLSVALLIVTGILFNRMGGEFIPTLDEGDFVIQPVLKTGTTLTKTAEITTQIEQILLDNFPEVSQVVSRIGAAEVPTDPMSMEESDVIIKLKPKREWVSADSKDELADKFKEKLTIIPGIDFEFTQPIEMRFNELITGVRADVAVKIFGEDLAVLADKADEIKSKIANVEGASDIIVEKIDGLPQMTVTYNRKKVARYGLNIQSLNEIVSMGFAGNTVGSVFEGERRFDLVVRLHPEYRKNIENLKNLYVDTPTGTKIPLHEVATIEYTKGPAKISRDDTKRRIVIGINVRNRDMESVVQDVREIIETQVKLPVGYTISYGGQFENLNSAKARLKIAVPIALFLIFIMLHFAFNSIKEALMIFSAIPLSAVGGVLFLWIRGLPFSISAGVGFIALFGIAVLNGIVLIEHLKSLKEQGFDDVNERILKGTKERLRPVILTAAAAALGFLPMAVSTNAGAEVQRPLATVVIGGLVTATILTMVVLPVLYAIFDTKKFKMKKRKVSPTAIIVLFMLIPFFGFSQEKTISLEELIAMAVKNNKELTIKSLEADESNKLIGSAFEIDKTKLYYTNDETNLGADGKPFKTYGIDQTIEFPTLYFARKKAQKITSNLAGLTYEMAKINLTKEVTKAFYKLVYLNKKLSYIKHVDSLYFNFSNAAKRKFELGESNYLEMITAQSKYKQYAAQLSQVNTDISIAYTLLNGLLQNEEAIKIIETKLIKIKVIKPNLEQHLLTEYSLQNSKLFQVKKGISTQELLPDIQFNYFNSKDVKANTSVNSFQAGVSIPLFFFGKSSKIAASKIAQDIANEQAVDLNFKLHSKYKILIDELKKSESQLVYFYESGNKVAKEILKTATSSYKNGEIDFFQYIQSIETSNQITLDYLSNLNLYNQIALEINYLNL